MEEDDSNGTDPLPPYMLMERPRMCAYTFIDCIYHTTRRDPPGAVGAEQFVHEQHPVWPTTL